MALVIKATNGNGQTIQLTQNSNFQLVAAQGLTPPKSNINTSPLATMDGSMFNSSKLQNRNIVLLVQPLGEIETNRQLLYQYFKVKKPVSIEVITKNRDVIIDGYVEDMQIDLNANPQLVQISIICPDPWFINKTATTVNILGETTSAQVNNPSDDDVGAVFTITMTGSVSEPNIQLNGRMTIEKDFISGNIITIDTRRGKKSVSYKTDSSSMSSIDLLNYLSPLSNFIMLHSGNNWVHKGAESGVNNMNVVMVYNSIFEGV